MAELLAVGQDLKNLTVANTSNQDGSANVKLNGNNRYKPEVRFTASEVASLVKEWTPKAVSAPPPVVTPPTPPTPPVETPVSTPQTPIIGCNVYGATAAEVQLLLAAGVNSARLEMGRDTISTWKGYGFKNNLVIVGNTEDNIPLSSVNIQSWVGTTVAQIETCIKENVVFCEVGNEMYLKNGNTLEPARYAEMFIALHNALVSKGIRNKVKLLFNAFGGSWISSAVSAQSSLKTDIDGFTHHPYGRPKENNDDNRWGPGATVPLHNETISLGIVNTDFYITEFGIEAPGGKGSNSIVAKSEAEENEWAKQVYTELLGTGFIPAIYWFGVKDGEGKWGLFEGATANARGVLKVIASFV